MCFRQIGDLFLIEFGVIELSKTFSDVITGVLEDYSGALISRLDYNILKVLELL